eukprot:6211042-Pleurochrysis_carterae.AAC.1
MEFISLRKVTCIQATYRARRVWSAKRASATLSGSFRRSRAANDLKRTPSYESSMLEEQADKNQIYQIILYHYPQKTLFFPKSVCRPLAATPPHSITRFCAVIDVYAITFSDLKRAGSVFAVKVEQTTKDAGKTQNAKGSRGSSVGKGQGDPDGKEYI